MVMEVRICNFSWTKEEEKAFENALATIPEHCDDRWERISDELPGKTIEEIKHHYELLVEDIIGIESGQVPLPCYVPSSEDGGDQGAANRRAGGHGDSGKSSKSDQERRKGIAWTEEEHRLFLLGLEKYGKGDWRSISRNLVISRTPTQVASHAQKYFIRLQSTSKDKRRTSIHDITNVNDDIVASKGPITGQSNGMMAAAPIASTYGATTICLPTPPAMTYRMQAPFLGAPFTGAPINLTSFPYSLPPTSTNR